jgi:hypothetical protein
MDHEYIVYKCKVCQLVFIIPIDGLRRAEVLGRYISCNLGHTQIEEVGRYDSLIECMEGARQYKRVNGRVHQIK